MLFEILSYLPQPLSSALRRLPSDAAGKLSEIRLRRDAPVVLVLGNRSCFTDEAGRLYAAPQRSCVRISSDVFDDVLMRLCDYTLHKVMHTLKEGYLTLPCGARVGVGLRAVYDNDTLIAADCVTSLNLRIPVAAEGCSLPLLQALYRNRLCSVLVAGAPNSGKTTLLRDMARQLSSGFDGIYRKVTLADERGELAGAGHTVGVNCDVLYGFPKAKGIEMAVRTLSPELIIADEIAAEQEASAVMAAFACGVCFALSVHAADERELLRKPLVKRLLSSGEFNHLVLLRGYSYHYDILEVSDEADGSGAAACLRYVDRFSAGSENPPKKVDLP